MYSSDTPPRYISSTPVLSDKCGIGHGSPGTHLASRRCTLVVLLSLSEVYCELYTLCTPALALGTWSDVSSVYGSFILRDCLLYVFLRLYFLLSSLIVKIWGIKDPYTSYTLLMWKKTNKANPALPYNPLGKSHT